MTKRLLSAGTSLALLATSSPFLAADARPGRDHDASPPLACLSPAARQLFSAIETTFGAMKVISTCRPGATIAGSGRPSKHASGNAVDFVAGARKAEVIAWLIANHGTGGTMTYADMDHIHVDIGPHFVSLAGRERTGLRTSRDLPPGRMGLGGRRRDRGRSDTGN